MRPFLSSSLALLALLFLAEFGARAQAQQAVNVEANLFEKIVNDQPVNPTTVFTKDAPMIYGWWKTKEGREGSIIRIVWIAEDVGQAAPPNYKVGEFSVKLDAGSQPAGESKDAKSVGFSVSAGQTKELAKKEITFGRDWNGPFKLSRPTNGWPLGRYRTEIYYDNQLVKTLPFRIQ